MSTYPHLLSPLRVAGVDLPNRMVMGAMHTRLETMDRPHERLAAFYAARAAGEIGLILTGGYSPVPEGVMDEGGLVLQKPGDLGEHRAITSAVNEAGGRIVLQILHAGRYAKVSTCVAPSAGKARINVFPPRALTTEEVWATVESFANTSALAELAGYAGIEIMGSEGYLINEFTAALTNQRDDEFGGDFERRIRFPLEIVKAVRARVSPEFMVIYRSSSIDLMDGGMTGEEVAEYLVGSAEESLKPKVFMDAWGVDTAIRSAGGLKAPAQHGTERVIHMFQRKPESLGKNLGKSTGWILKAKLRKAGVAMTAGASYQAVDDQGLHYSVNGEARVLDADTVILCAGQLSNRTLFDGLAERGVKPYVIGGADVAAELDALRAIDQATRLAVSF